LHSILGDREPMPEDLPRLRYTVMVLKESMRLYPAVWGIGRKAIADCEIGGYRVTEGTNIFIFQSLTQRDPRFFPNPLGRVNQALALTNSINGGLGVRPPRAEL